jgi:hypothetical protein
VVCTVSDMLLMVITARFSVGRSSLLFSRYPVFVLHV